MSKSSQQNQKLLQKALENTQELNSYANELKCFKSKHKEELKVNSINKAVIKGTVQAIVPINSNFGYSYKIFVGGQPFYFSCSLETTCEKLFKLDAHTSFKIKTQGAINIITEVLYSEL
jgi:hypothetical protein